MRFVSQILCCTSRCGGGTEQGRYFDYEVPAADAGQTVARCGDVIQRKLDSTLSVSLWRAASACAVVCDDSQWRGRAGPAASKKNCPAKKEDACLASGEGGKLQIGAAGQPACVRDLATDMREFFDKWARAKGAVTKVHVTFGATIFAPVKPQRKKRKRGRAGIECIACGVCYAAMRRRWLAQRLPCAPRVESRVDTNQRCTRRRQGPNGYSAVGGDAGCHSCHTHLSCTESLALNTFRPLRRSQVEAGDSVRLRSGESCDTATRMGNAPVGSCNVCRLQCSRFV